MYSLPQEIEVWYIIPAIRKEFARVLTERYRLTFENTGRILGVSKSAVSQYLNKRRAGLIKIPKEIRKEIEFSSSRMIKNENLAVKEIVKILNLMKRKGCSCLACKKFNKGILKKCCMKPIKGV